MIVQTVLRGIKVTLLGFGLLSLSVFGSTQLLAQQPLQPSAQPPAQHPPLPNASGQATAPNEGNGQVTGRIIGNPEKGSLKGASVVLLRFQLDASGKPQGGPVGRVQAGEGGTYAFSKVPIDRKAVYRIGTRIDGNLISSNVFSFPADTNKVVMDVVIPEVTQDLSVLTMTQALLAIEPRQGGVFVTEVLHLSNPAPNILDATKEPFQLSIPADSAHFEMLSQGSEDIRHEQIGSKLMVFSQFRPGENTLAFRYLLPTSFGSLTLRKSYPVNTTTVMVLSPSGGLEVGGAGLIPGAQRDLDGTKFNVWTTPPLPAGNDLTLGIDGIPVSQWIFLIFMSAIPVFLSGVVIWFVMVRLKRKPAKG